MSYALPIGPTQTGGFYPEQKPMGQGMLPPVAPPVVAKPAQDPWAALIAAIVGQQQPQHAALDFSSLLHAPSRHLDLSGNEISTGAGAGPWSTPLKFNDRATQMGNDAWASGAVAHSHVPTGVNTQNARAAGAAAASPAPFVPSGAPLDPRLFAADPALHAPVGNEAQDTANMLNFNHQLTQPGGFAAILGQLIKPSQPQVKRATMVHPPREAAGSYPASMMA